MITVKKLSKNYGSLNVLNKINFDVNEGEIISIIGPSGCGKTTLLKIIGGITSTTDGKVLIRDHLVQESLKRKEIGFVFQNPVLLPWLNVKQNIELPLDIMGREIREIPITSFEEEIEEEKTFYGWDGLRIAMDDILNTLHRDNEYVVFMMGEIAFTEKKLNNFFSEYHKKRVRAGIRVRALSSNKILKFIRKEKKSQYDVISYKILENKYPKGVNIYNNKIIFISWDYEHRMPRVNVVTSKKLADAYRLLFEKAWEMENLPMRLLDLVELSGFESYSPNSLSGGMRVRASLARTLIFDPQILLMDEPFSALDELTRERLQFELLKIWRKTKKTMILVTHSISEAVFLSDRIVVLSKRPAKIEKIIDVDLPRPRKIEIKYSKKYIELIKCIRKTLKED